ncbi:MAG TPA: hypothetical protein VHF22_09860 [Planctomycetota bacterium]|nr:hypothetical protein [Planctomycetota bacterium]
MRTSTFLAVLAISVAAAATAQAAPPTATARPATPPPAAHYASAGVPGHPDSIHDPIHEPFIRLGFEYTPLDGGNVGKGFTSAPDYSDAFDSGLGLTLQGGYRWGRFAPFLGFDYGLYRGQTISNAAFGDWYRYDFYAGLRIHLFEGAWTPFGPEADAGALDPYASLRAGASYSDSVDVSAVPPGSSTTVLSTSYWKSGWLFNAGVSIGLEYRFPGGLPLSAFLEGGFRWLTGPEASDPFTSDFDGEDAFTFPIAVGLAFHW